jgi:hypothetical protein
VETTTVAVPDDRGDHEAEQDAADRTAEQTDGLDLGHLGADDQTERTVPDREAEARDEQDVLDGEDREGGHRVVVEEGQADEARDHPVDHERGEPPTDRCERPRT